MTIIKHYAQYKSSHAEIIEAISARLDGIDEEAHWDLVDEMKGVFGASFANDSTDNEADQDDALSRAESWIADNCSSGGIAEDVAMALWLRGPKDGESFLLSHQIMAVSAPGQTN